MASLLLLDGHSLAYRAFYALPEDMATPDGTLTNAVFGFTSMLAKILADEKPDLVGVAFDAPTKSFRHAMDPEYKAGRKKTPEEFIGQLPLIREVLATLKIPTIEIEGVEADDVIATLATQGIEKNIDVLVVTGDRDAYQLVKDPHLKVLYNLRGVSDYARYDEAGIFERTGVTPAQYPEYAALRGDPSDNLPGVPGIGEKTAAKLIATYGTVDSILAHLEELKPKQRENLAAMGDRVRLNHEMSILRRDVDCGVTASELIQGEFDAAAVKDLFESLAFRTLFPRIMDAVGERAAPGTNADADKTLSEPTIEIELDVLKDAKSVASYLSALKDKGEPYSLEASWDGVPGRSTVLGLAVAGESTTAVYLEGAGLADPEVKAALVALVGENGPPLVAHRAKELMRALNVDMRNLDRDTAVMAYVLDPSESKYRLEDLFRRYLSIDAAEQETGTLDLDGTAGVVATGQRAHNVFRLGQILAVELEDKNLTSLYERFERPLVRVLALIERTGILIDQKFLSALRDELHAECDLLMRSIWQHAGREFNVNSTQQLRVVLFENLGLTPVKKTKTGPSTDADSLNKMIDLHPIIVDLLRYREVEKLRSTYADALPPLIDSDGRIHATFKQTDTTTGRISSEMPNLQNIPVRSSEGREFRRVFVAPSGSMILTADYSQIELRVLAHLAQDPGLIDAFARGADIHTATAAKVFGIDESKVDPDHRRFAKVVNYGLAFGMEAYGLGQRMDVPTEQAKEILDDYFSAFPNVHAFMDKTIAETKTKGYTETLFGRRRNINELASDNFRIRQMGERMALNAPIQGTAADLFKLSMIDVDKALETGGFSTRTLLSVHDEMVFEVPEVEREKVTGVIRETMQSVAKLIVPLVVDVGFGPNWAEAK
ncbi:DNA polymerase [Actinomycetes bacterium]|nr:DNA polymerase [Actinomycetes bacterium]